METQHLILYPEILTAPYLEGVLPTDRYRKERNLFRDVIHKSEQEGEDGEAIQAPCKETHQWNSLANASNRGWGRDIEYIMRNSITQSD